MLGPEVGLDSTQEWVLALFQRLRRQTPPDAGIAIPEDANPILERLLVALDDVYSEGQKLSVEEAKARSAEATPPDVTARRH